MNFCPWCGQSKDWLSTAEVAQFLGVNARNLRKACRAGRIPGAELVRRSPRDRGAYRIPISVVSALAGTVSAADS
jgi:hypothetical protein